MRAKSPLALLIPAKKSISLSVLRLETWNDHQNDRKSRAHLWVAGNVLSIGYLVKKVARSTIRSKIANFILRLLSNLALHSRRAGHSAQYPISVVAVFQKPSVQHHFEVFCDNSMSNWSSFSMFTMFRPLYLGQSGRYLHNLNCHNVAHSLSYP